MLAGAVFLEFQPRQLLDLFWRVKTSDIAYLCEEACYRDETYSLDCEQLLNVRHLLRFRFQYLCDLLQLFLLSPEILQEHLQVLPCAYTAIHSDALLRGLYQGLCPLHTDRAELMLTPDLVDALCAESEDICRVRRFFQYQQCALCGKLAIDLEELREIYWGVGLEYNYNDQFFLRGGYHFEDEFKGNRKYYTIGAGFRMNVFSLDAAYLVSTAQSNPLDQTLRFTLSFDMDGLQAILGR